MAMCAVAVLGAGNGGCAIAADLSRRGYRVRVFSRSRETLRPLVEAGGVRFTGVIGEGFAPLELASNDIGPVVKDAAVVILSVPTSALPYYAGILGPALPAEQLVMLNPGHMGGGLFLAAEIHRLTGRADLRFCETNTLTHAGRLKEPGYIHVKHLVRNVLFAAFPGKHRASAYAQVVPLFENLVEADSVLETGFLDINAVEHPAQILCNAGWLEHTAGSYLFYYEGTTPAVARVIQAVDRERMQVAAAIGVRTRSFLQYFYESGYTSRRAAESGDIYLAFRESEPNRWVKGPRSLDHRYVHEDVGWGLVPWAELGRAFGVPTPVMDSLITLASTMNEIDYRREGLTLVKMGLGGDTLTRLDSFLGEGYR